MTDRDLVQKKLVRIQECVDELRKLCTPSEIETNVVVERFAEHTLQIAIQSALDVAAHIVSDERLGEPRTHRELFDSLARHGWLTDALARTLGQMVGFRNILVHGYEAVDTKIVRSIVEERLDDLLGFVSEIQCRIAD